MSTGCDFLSGWAPGLGAKLSAVGITFAMRYLANPDKQPPKALSAQEVADDHAAGLGVGLIYETDGRSGPMAGAAGGAADAAAAIASARALGAPSGTAIYFAVDFDAQPAHRNRIASYAATVTALCHAAGFRSGIYGGLRVMSWVQHLCDYGWQTEAWSYGSWNAWAVLRQAGTVTVPGLTADRDLSRGPFGVWAPPAPVVEEDPDMTMRFTAYTPAGTAIFLALGGRVIHVDGGDDDGSAPTWRAKQPISMVMLNRLLGYPEVPAQGYPSTISDTATFVPGDDPYMMSVAQGLAFQGKYGTTAADWMLTHAGQPVPIPTWAGQRVPPEPAGGWPLP